MKPALLGRLRAHALGLEVLLAGHTNTERGYLPRLAESIRARHPGVEVVVSERDRDPILRETLGG